MDYQSAFAISAAGMNVEQTRFSVAALNLANANSVLGRDGSGYRPLVAMTGTGASAEGFGTYMDQSQALLAMRPRVTAVVEQSITPRKVFEPAHPQADEKGFVSMPGVNSTQEMLNIMTALRAYEANVVAMNAAKSMALKALEVGSNG